jgi:hypothetical protein
VASEAERDVLSCASGRGTDGSEDGNDGSEDGNGIVWCYASEEG